MRKPAQSVVPRCTVLTRAGAALLGVAGCAAGLAGAAPLQFTTSLEQSTWLAQSSRARCVLSHTIADYGAAEFTRTAGQPLHLRIDLPKPPVTAYQVEVRAAPPPWKHAGRAIAFGKQLVDPTARALVLDGAEAQALFDALERGLNLEFAFGPVGAPPQALVAVSAVRFLLAAPDFLTCSVALSTAPPQRAASKPKAQPTPGTPADRPVMQPTRPSSSIPASNEVEDPYIRATPKPDKPPETEPEPDPKTSPEPKPEPEPKQDAGAGLGLVEEVRLAYAPTQDELSETARIELGSFAREYLAQKRRDVVLIAGSAEHGPLTRRRALEIKGYLVRLGMPATHVMIHVPGEKLPQRDGQTVQLPADATRMSVWRVR